MGEDWYESEDEYLDLKEASTIQLNDRVICSLHQYLEDDIVGKRLYRNACCELLGGLSSKRLRPSLQSPNRHF
ncbi:hypothetical protein E4U16_004834, partial [Claviceps sp. LM84 group G4]